MTTPTPSVADIMRSLAETLARDLAPIVGDKLSFSEASVALLDNVIPALATNATDSQARNMAAVKLGAYVGEVLCRHRGGAWVKDEPGMPAGMPMVCLGRDYAITVPVLRQLLDGKRVDVGGHTVSSAAAYLEAVIQKQREWLDGVLLAGAPDATVKQAMSADGDLAEFLLVQTEAAIMTAAMRWGVFLDLSPDSLKGVEEILGQLHEAMRAGTAVPPETLRRATLSWGAYVGEVMRRHLGGRWINTPVGTQGAVLRLEVQGAQVFPLGKVEKRLKDGPADAIPFYFHATREIVNKRSS